LELQKGDIGKFFERAEPCAGRDQFRVWTVHLDEENFSGLAKTRNELLRSLPDPIPGEMRVNDDGDLSRFTASPGAVCSVDFA
jgi:hypothetical protein